MIVMLACLASIGFAAPLNNYVDAIEGIEYEGSLISEALTTKGLFDIPSAREINKLRVFFRPQFEVFLFLLMKVFDYFAIFRPISLKGFFRSSLQILPLS